MRSITGLTALQGPHHWAKNQTQTNWPLIRFEKCLLLICFIDPSSLKNRVVNVIIENLIVVALLDNTLAHPVFVSIELNVTARTVNVRKLFTPWVILGSVLAQYLIIGLGYIKFFDAEWQFKQVLTVIIILFETFSTQHHLSF